MSAIQIDIGKAFSRYPAGRFTEDGPHSGQQFRDEHLLPHLRRGSVIEIILDNTAGYGSSFLEEAFGGLIREGISPDDVRRLIILTSEDPALKDEIHGYIEDEIKRRRG